MNQQQNEKSQHDHLRSETNDDEIDLIGLIQTLGEEKWLLLGIPCLFVSIAAAVSLLISPMYTAKATFIVPDKQSSSAASILDQAGGLAGLAGNLSKSPAEMYMAFMHSNTVQDLIISELDLRERYQTKTKDDTRKKLSSLVKITTDKKSGLITIEAQDKSPDIAARLANSYLKPFRTVLDRMSLEEAHLRRDFFAQQIAVIAQRPFRDPYLQSMLMNTMIKQYELARIDGGKETQAIFPLDIAEIPERRTSPKRANFVLVSGLAAFFLTLLWIFIKRILRQTHNDPTLSQKWGIVKKAWKLRA